LTIYDLFFNFFIFHLILPFYFFTFYFSLLHVTKLQQSFYIILMIKRDFDERPTARDERADSQDERESYFCKNLLKTLHFDFQSGSYVRFFEKKIFLSPNNAEMSDFC